MSYKTALAALGTLTEASLGVFRAVDATEVSRKQLSALRAAGVIVREFPELRAATATTSHPGSKDVREDCSIATRRRNPACLPAFARPPHTCPPTPPADVHREHQ